MDLRFAQQLLQWFDQHGRKDLPWQKNTTAYRVWVSEIMLQQTQVKTVIPYYRRFMRRFPSLSQLAAAPLDEVLHHWTGLGYYARARNLHKTAHIIATQHHRRFPRSVEALQQLPGIGRSTAGAICAIAFGQHATILDGNVKRVLARYHGVYGWSGSSAVQGQLWQFAEQHTPQQRCADYTQAIMDLGATVCTRSKPQCEQCPLHNSCFALQHQQQSQLPTPKARTTLPQRHCHMLLIEHRKQLLLEQRPSAGLWGGLWSFPEFSAELDIAQWCAIHYPQNTSTLRHLGQHQHNFSHYQLIIQAHHLRLSNKASTVGETNTQIWYNLQQPPAIGTSAVVQKLLKLIVN